MKTFNSFAAILMAGGSALAMASAAHAQQASSPADVTEVVVTGSRVITNGNNSPNPVTVVTADQALQMHPTILADALNDLPVFSGSMTQTSNPGNSSRNSAQNQLNLRAVGATRNLVLFDGHRMTPIDTQGAVDVDMIPQMLIQRVDVVTGGASAVYGSDAISGVVNFITDKNFNGIKANAQTGISEYGDGQIFDTGVAFGTKLFGGRGHFEGSYQYHNDAGIFDKLNRPWGKLVWTEQGGGTAANPYHLVTNTRLSNTSFLGTIQNGALVNAAGGTLVFRQNGVLDRFNHGTATGTNNVESGGDGAYYYTASLKSLLVSHQVFGRFDYDITDSVHGYLEVSGTQNHNRNNHQLNETLPRVLNIGYNNPYLRSVQPQYQTVIAQQLAANPLSSFGFAKQFQDMPTLQPDAKQTEYMVLGGLDGSLGDYKWEAGFEHSEAFQKTRQNANIDQSHLYAALNAVINPANGQIVCNAALVNPALYGNCVPLNPFGPTSESQDAINYVVQRTGFTAHYKMDDVTGSITGSPVSTWAGPIQMAVSGEYRKLEFDLQSDSQPSDRINCTGIQFNCTLTAGLPPTRWASNVQANRSPVSQAVGEVAYEFDAPLLKDKPFFESLNLNGAVRYTKYKNDPQTTGQSTTEFTATTWKIGLDWHLNSDFTFRATRSRDIRAPNLNDLFASDLVNPAGFVDVHTGNVSGLTNFVTKSNPNLQPEKADTTTAGVVWRPSAIPGFSLSIDAYRITINDAISSVQGQNVVVQGLCESSGGTSIYCDLIHRPFPFSNRTAANYPFETISLPLNIAQIDTYGADVEGNYAGMAWDRAYSLRGLISYQPHIRYDQGPAGIVDMGNAASGGPGGTQPSPSVKVTLQGNIDLPFNLRLQVQERWRSAMRRSGVHTQVYTDPKVPSIKYTDATLTYAIKGDAGNTDLFLNVKNLFNQQPVPVANTGGASSVPGLFGGYAQGDDPVGRYYMVGVRFRR